MMGGKLPRRVKPTHSRRIGSNGLILMAMALATTRLAVFVMIAHKLQAPRQSILRDVLMVMEMGIQIPMVQFVANSL